MVHQRNAPEVVAQSFRSTDWTTNECPKREVMAQSDETRGGLSDPPDSDDCKTQRPHVSA